MAFDDIGPWAPFFIVGCCDAFLMFAAIALAMMGKI
jgi:hypothetical protein